MPEEAEEELDSDKDPPAPVSSRVHFIIIIIIYVFFFFWLEIVGTRFVDECVYLDKIVFGKSENFMSGIFSFALLDLRDSVGLV